MNLYKFIKQPVFVMPLLSAIVIFSWIQFVTPTNNMQYDSVAAEQNMLMNPSFEEWDKGMPKGWKITGDNTADFNVMQSGGHTEGYSTKIHVNDYSEGSVTIKSPAINVEPKKSYFFKSFYLTDTRLDLMVEKTAKNGTVTTELLKHYPDYDYEWSSLSGIVRTNENDKSFKIMLVLTKNGFLQLDDSYVVSDRKLLEQNKTRGKNLLDSSTWNFFQSGVLSASSSSEKDVKTIEIHNHHIGQATWKPSPISVSPNELLTYSVNYRSKQKTEIGVDYQLRDGTSDYQVIKTLYPTPQITTTTVDIEVPENVVSMQPSVQLGKAGKLETKNLKLIRKKAPATFNEPMISITFDDGWLSSYKNGSRLLEKYGFRGTFYINPGALDTRQFMTTSNIQDLLSNGHQIGSHTYSHIDLTSYHGDKVMKELDDANKAINNFGVNEIDFASPYGKHDRGVLPLIMDRHLTHRGTDIGINTKQNINRNNLKGLFIRKEVTDIELRDFIRQAETSNGWLILIYHQVEPSESPFALDRSTLNKHLKIIKNSGIKVQTVRKASKQLIGY